MEHRASARILFLSDTHLGFDLPMSPRLDLARRGQDFFANFESALQPAFEGKVDLVIYGGDLFFRTRASARLVDLVSAPLLRLAQTGMPIFIVPGNHERSRLPLRLWFAHENIHIFEKPTTFLHQCSEMTVALAGFPFTPKVRPVFSNLVRQTRFAEIRADIHLLCIHQAVEGAQVGAANYTFRNGPEVVAGRDIPRGFQVVLAGHIHRAQLLDHDLRHQPLNAPVIYPGSIERTSLAERNEPKGYVILNLKAPIVGSQTLEISRVWLPTRPMNAISLDTHQLSKAEVKERIKRRLQDFLPNSVVRIDLRDFHSEKNVEYIPAAELRQLAPAGMIITSRLPDELYHRNQKTNKD